MSKKVNNNIRNGLIGIVILVFGVVFGIILLGQNQDYRNKAKEILNQSYSICHRVGVTDNRWEDITVKTEELSTRLNQGDIFGKCPENLLNSNSLKP
jgi:hypothetical protein